MKEICERILARKEELMKVSPFIVDRAIRTLDEINGTSEHKRN